MISSVGCSPSRVNFLVPGKVSHFSAAFLVLACEHFTHSPSWIIHRRKFCSGFGFLTILNPLPLQGKQVPAITWLKCFSVPLPAHLPHVTFFIACLLVVVVWVLNSCPTDKNIISHPVKECKDYFQLFFQKPFFVRKELLAVHQKWTKVDPSEPGIILFWLYVLQTEVAWRKRFSDMRWKWNQQIKGC